MGLTLRVIVAVAVSFEIHRGIVCLFCLSPNLSFFCIIKLLVYVVWASTAMLKMFQRDQPLSLKNWALPNYPVPAPHTNCPLLFFHFVLFHL